MDMVYETLLLKYTWNIWNMTCSLVIMLDDAHDHVLAVSNI
jgi:hypothetical protein